MKEQENDQRRDGTIEVYEKPQIEIIEMEIEGNYLLSASSGGDNLTGDGGWGS